MEDLLIRYRQLGIIFDYLSLGVVLLSRDRRIISINQSAELLTGRKEREVQGKFCYHTFLDYLCGGRCKFLEEGGPSSESSCSDIEITDGTVASRNITKIESPLYNPEGEIIGCMEVFQDNTAFHQLLQRVKFDDRRLKMILDNLDIGVLTVDRGSHVTFFNTMSENITGYDRAQVLGKPCTTIFPIDFCKDVLELKKTPADVTSPKRLEAEVITRQGTRIPIEAQCMALKNEEGRIVGGLTTITDLSLKYHLNRVIRDQYTSYDMVGRDPSMQKIFEIIPVVAASEATVLIEGPTGTGKDILAKIIHTASKRSASPLIKVNCAALPGDLLESEMFGYVKGAFTGADRDKPGRFQLADGGTIFLDEIGDLPLSLQGKLLRVLEDREFYPLGSRRTAKVDVRIIAATNQGLEGLVQEKRFREDLYYRINVMRLDLPPLRRRKSDIPLLISHILRRMGEARGRRIEKISEEAMEVLLNYDYPGNVRELENILEHALIICQGATIRYSDLPLSLQRPTATGDAPEQSNDLRSDEFRMMQAKGEKELIRARLLAHGGHRGKTAADLHINRTTLWRKMKKHGIDG